MSFVRSSKFRHVFGNNTKADGCYTGFKPDGTGDSNCAVSRKFLAFIKNSKIFVIGLDKTGRHEENNMHYIDCKNKVLDVAWSPFHDNVLASCEESGHVNIWTIPEDGLEDVMSEPSYHFSKQTKKVTFIQWHPTAEYILAVGGFDSFISILDIGPECDSMDSFIDIPVGENPTNMAWNYDGSLIAITTKIDRKMALQIVNPRTGEVLQTNEQCHLGTKPTKVVFMKGGAIITVGVDKNANRSIVLWDKKDITKEVDEISIGSGSANPVPYLDLELNVLFTYAKGESVVKYYEIENEKKFYFLAAHPATSSQKGGSFIPKYAVDPKLNEIARFYKLHADKCEPISFIVPRKSETFQKDIYPECSSSEPAMSSQEWVNGKNHSPLKHDFQTVYDGSQCQTQKKDVRPMRKALPKRDAGGAGENTDKTRNAPSYHHQQQANNGIPEGIDFPELLEDMKKVKATVRKLNKRVNKLEEQLKKAGIIPEEEEE
ncbi:coronin-1A-like [Styela clava]